MKKIYFLFLFLILFSFNIIAQAPQLINYQAVVRNPLGNILPNKLVTFKIGIIKGSALGTAVYEETHSKSTNEFGLVNLKIGGGTVLTGDFSNIDWAIDTYFIKVELDINAGTNYEFMGTTQLLSVPYAIFAEKAGNASDDFDKDSLNEIQSINKVGNTVTLSKNGGSFTDDDNQTLSLNGNQLTINNGNTVTFTGSVDLDADPVNELQNLSLINDTLKISQGNEVFLPYDRDSTNELQNLNVTNNILSISKGNSVVIDSDTTNELQTLSINSNIISISNGNSIVLPQNNDNDSLNELQIMNLSHDTLFLSKGNFVIFPSDKDRDSINEIQNLSINYKSLSISKGNTVTINYGPTFIQPIILTSNLQSNSQIIDLSTYSIPVTANAVIVSLDFSNAGASFNYSKNLTSPSYGGVYQYGEHQVIIPIENLTFVASKSGTPSLTWKVIAYY